MTTPVTDISASSQDIESQHPRLIPRRSSKTTFFKSCFQWLSAFICSIGSFLKGFCDFPDVPDPRDNGRDPMTYTSEPSFSEGKANCVALSMFAILFIGVMAICSKGDEYISLMQILFLLLSTLFVMCVSSIYAVPRPQKIIVLTFVIMIPEAVLAYIIDAHFSFSSAYEAVAIITLILFGNVIIAFVVSEKL